MSYSSVTVSGIESFLVATGPVNPFAGIGMADSQPGWDHSFSISVEGGYISSSLSLPFDSYPDGGLAVVTVSADPAAPGQIDGLVIAGTAAAVADYLAVDFQVTPDPGGSGDITTFLTAVGPYPGVNFVGSGASPVFDGLATTVACYLRGTGIATPTGEVAIEHIRPGDRVLCADGAVRPVRWIGLRRYDNPPSPVQPVCFRVGALAEGVPSRDLYVSPLHAMLVDGVLVPAVHLVNGLSIVACRDFASVDYLHLELDAHAALLAHGAPSESFADCDNRWMFHVSDPDFDDAPVPSRGAGGGSPPGPDPLRWSFCAERLESGPRLVAIRERLAARAASLPSVRGAGAFLFMLADGRAVMPQTVTAGRATFRLPSAPADLRLISRGPARGRSADTPPLGIRLRRIVLRSRTATVAVSAAEATLAAGFHPAEPGGRWTDGGAVVPAELLASLSGPLAIEVEADGLAWSPASHGR